MVIAVPVTSWLELSWLLLSWVLLSLPVLWLPPSLPALPFSLLLSFLLHFFWL